MLATLLLLCFIVAPPETAPPVEPAVRLLLFAQSTPRSVVISSTTPFTFTIGGTEGQSSEQASSGTRIEVTVAKDGGVIAQGHGGAEVKIVGEGIMLQSDGRRRRVSGELRIAAAAGQLMVVATIPEREYLTVALASESTIGEPLQYLIALSVLQRNYLRTHRGRHQPSADLCDNTHCQRADNINPSPTAKRAVAESERVRCVVGNIYPCYYSANCGGRTLTPQQVWHKEEPGYRSVACGFCKRGKWHRWKRAARATPQLEELVKQAPFPPFINDDFKIAVGRAIGFNVVLSNTVEKIERRNGKFWFSGRGFGHRVGLCCAGGVTLARRGKSATQILQWYFPDAAIAVIGKE